MVIVATAMDNSTERIITYLRNTYMVDINILFFHVFSYNDKRFISRAWFAEDAEEAPAPVVPVGNLWHIAITKANRLWRQYRHTIHQNQQQPGLSIRAVAHVVGVAVYPRGQNGGFAFTSLSRAVSAASVYPPAAMRTLRRLLSELRARRKTAKWQNKAVRREAVAFRRAAFAYPIEVRQPLMARASPAPLCCKKSGNRPRLGLLPL